MLMAIILVTPTLQLRRPFVGRQKNLYTYFIHLEILATNQLIKGVETYFPFLLAYQMRCYKYIVEVFKKHLFYIVVQPGSIYTNLDTYGGTFIIFGFSSKKLLSWQQQRCE